MFTFESSFDAFCYSFWNLKVLPEDNVTKKTNEPSLFAITVAFEKLSIETKVWISSALLASMCYMLSSSWDSWIPFGFAAHFRAQRAWQALCENLKAQGVMFCVAKRKGYVLRLAMLFFVSVNQNALSMLMGIFFKNDGITRLDVCILRNSYYLFVDVLSWLNSNRTDYFYFTSTLHLWRWGQTVCSGVLCSHYSSADRKASWVEKRIFLSPRLGVWNLRGEIDTPKHWGFWCPGCWEGLIFWSKDFIYASAKMQNDWKEMTGALYSRCRKCTLTWS